MTKTNENTNGGLSRRGFLGGAPGVLMVGALAAPAILSPDMALASSPHSQLTIRFVDQTLASIRSRSPSISAGTFDITAFERRIDKTIKSHSSFVHYRGNRTASYLLNQRVDLTGRAVGPLTWQLMPSSIRSMSSLSIEDETGHGQRLERAVIDHRALDRRRLSNRGTPRGMANGIYERDIQKTADGQTWIKQFRHKNSGKNFFVFSNHHAVGSDNEWRYVISKDLSSATATRFYAMRDAERSLEKANWAVAGAIILGAIGTAAVAVEVVPTGGASVTAIGTLITLVGGSIGERAADAKGLADAHQRYNAQFLLPFSSGDRSGYLLNSSSVADWDAEFDALGIS